MEHMRGKTILKTVLESKVEEAKRREVKRRVYRNGIANPIYETTFSFILLYKTYCTFQTVLIINHVRDVQI